jgi:hypothetical protein
MLVEARLEAAPSCAIARIQVPLDALVVPEMMDCLTWLWGLDCYAQAFADAAISYPMLWPMRI